MERRTTDCRGSENIEMQAMDKQPPASAEPEKRSAGFWGWIHRVHDIVMNVNRNVNRSTFGRVFRLKDSGHVSSFIRDYRMHHSLMFQDYTPENKADRCSEYSPRLYQMLISLPKFELA
jgi:hypothetical protein